jgi:hypothetical protein
VFDGRRHFSAYSGVGKFHKYSECKLRNVERASAREINTWTEQHIHTVQKTSTKD